MDLSSISRLSAVRRQMSGAVPNSWAQSLTSRITGERKNHCERVKRIWQMRRDSARREAGHGVLKQGSNIGHGNVTVFSVSTREVICPNWKNSTNGFTPRTNL